MLGIGIGGNFMYVGASKSITLGVYAFGFGADGCGDLDIFVFWGCRCFLVDFSSSSDEGLYNKECLCLYY